jgi:hypothetical protein
MRVLKLILLAVAIVLLAGILFSIGSWFMFQGTPDWYQPLTWTPEQREVVARTAEDELARATSWAAAAQARETRKRVGVTEANPLVISDDPETHVITLKEDALNALMNKWSVIWSANYPLDKYLSDPVFILQKNRLIVAGKVHELNGVIASVHFEPKLTKAGNLQMDLVQVLGGKLPIPSAMYNDYREKALSALKSRLPNWQKNAQIESNGDSNDYAVGAAMAKLVIQALRHEDSDPTIFLRIDRKSFPARLTGIEITDDHIALTLRALNSEERVALLESIKEPYSSSTARAR